MWQSIKNLGSRIKQCLFNLLPFVGDRQDCRDEKSEVKGLSQVIGRALEHACTEVLRRYPFLRVQPKLQKLRQLVVRDIESTYPTTDLEQALRYIPYRAKQIGLTPHVRGWIIEEVNKYISSSDEIRPLHPRNLAAA